MPKTRYKFSIIIIIIIIIIIRNTFKTAAKAVLFGGKLSLSIIIIIIMFSLFDNSPPVSGV